MAIEGTASADIEASPQNVWAVVQDIETWGEWQDKIGTVEALERDTQGQVVRCRVVIDAGIQTIKLVLSFVREPGAQRIAWTREEGDLKGMDGSWALADLGDGRTRATYALKVEPGGMLGLFITGQVEERLREGLVDVRPNELKARVENG